jgi:hypothetical protein
MGIILIAILVGLVIYGIACIFTGGKSSYTSTYIPSVEEEEAMAAATAALIITGCIGSD